MPEIDPIRKNNVTVTGNPNAGQTMIFVHGFGLDQSSWDAIARPFLNDYRIVLFDNFGAGRAESNVSEQHRYLNLNGYAEDLLAICEVLELRDTIAIGHSSGAMTCLLAAIKEPARFAKLVMIGASPRYLNDGDYNGGFTSDDIDATYSAVTSHFLEWVDTFAPVAMDNFDRPELAAYFAETLRAIPAEEILTVLCSILQSDYRADLGKLEKPTLLIQSSKDFFVPLGVAEYLHKHIRGSRLSLVKATGHFPHLSNPDEIVSAIKAFITL